MTDGIDPGGVLLALVFVASVSLLSGFLLGLAVAVVL